ncbi:MAG: thiamine pyrophosphate-dependent dehydrogenase E1 component subunit alpha [bacterium]
MAIDESNPLVSAQASVPLPAMLELLKCMTRIRCVEETIAARYGEQKMRCPVHLSIGQEGSAAGVCLALEQNDQVVSTHRAHAHYLAKGGDLKRMIAEIYGKKTGCSGGKGGSMHLIDLSVGFLGSTAIVANTIPIGVGAALSNRILGNGKVACVFFGDAAIEEGVFHEAANFAVVRKLPVIFVCENNLYSVYSPLGVRQPADRAIWRFAAGYGMAATHGDGNDAPAVHALARQAVDHVRSGKGPFFLELATYRWREHCGPHFDNDLGYRTVEEFQEWQVCDPISRLETHLKDTSVLNESALRKMEKDITDEVEDAFRFAEESEFPDAAEVFRQVFAGDEPS